MNQFLETLKSKLAEAQKRFAEAQQNMQKAQVEFQSAAQELTSWQVIVNAETRKAQATIAPAVSAPMLPVIPSTTATVEGAVTRIGAENKTQVVRELLRQHPTGMTARELWEGTKTRITHRQYLYSILKRLRDKEEVSVRRGKYTFKISPGAQEGSDHATTVQ